MKKNNILKALGILFLLFVIISWIIPAGYFNNGEYTGTTIMPIGLFDVIIYPFMALTSSVFVLYAIDVLLIGALYGVMNKTGFYSNLIDKIVKKIKGHERIFLVVTTILFTLLSTKISRYIIIIYIVCSFWEYPV